MTIHSFSEHKPFSRTERVTISFQFNELTKPLIRNEAAILIRLLNSIVDSSMCAHLMTTVISTVHQLLATKNVDELLMYYFCIELDIINENIHIREMKPLIKQSNLRFSLN